MDNLKFNGTPDFEDQGSTNEDGIYEIAVKAVDEGGNISIQPLKITITNDPTEDSISPTITGPGGNKTQGKSEFLKESELSFFENIQCSLLSK